MIEDRKEDKGEESKKGLHRKERLAWICMVNEIKWQETLLYSKFNS